MRPARKIAPQQEPLVFEKTPSGIAGIDAITYGGLPKNRSTLICGGAGSGKTLLGMEFLVAGATKLGEPGVFISFEETRDDLAKNVISLGFDLAKLEKSNLLRVDQVHIDRSEIEESGEYDLDGLFIRIRQAADEVGAKRIVIDTIESLFSGLKNTNILRSEIRRLFRFLKECGLTAIITAERGDAETLTRDGIEEYVSDCVILLDHRIDNQLSTRRLRIVKYRGSLHGTNEYPYLIDDHGYFVFPVTSLELQQKISPNYVSTGVPKLDEMLGGNGFYEGTTILISGSAGTGKTSITSKILEKACSTGKRCVYFAFEESPDQIIRNMSSIGIDLAAPLKAGLLRIKATRPTSFGLEQHLVTMVRCSEEFKPDLVVIDPISDLMILGDVLQVRMMLTRLIDHFKSLGITAVLTNLLDTKLDQHQELSASRGIPISSLIDSWLLLRDNELGGERTRLLYVIKSRGQANSNQVREFVLTDSGLDLVDVCIGEAGVLTGSARQSEKSRVRMEIELRKQEAKALEIRLQQRRNALESEHRIRLLKLDQDEAIAKSRLTAREQRDRVTEQDRNLLAEELGSKGSVKKSGGGP